MGENNLVRSPLQMPVNSPQFLRTFVFNRAPTTADWRNFEISDMWVYRNPGVPTYGFFVLVDKPNSTGIWLNLSANATQGIQMITPDSGITVLPDINQNVNILGGTGITTVGTANTLTINSTITGLTWIVDTLSPINVNINEGHFANGVGPITYNLPATMAVGDGFGFIDLGGNGFVIQANAGQTYQVGNQATSVGGTITSSAIGDAIFFVCGVANTRLNAFSLQGNFTVA